LARAAAGTSAPFKGITESTGDGRARPER
jgi:hypothetical protein